jgi:arylsulfatase A-like enzyme
MRWPGRIPAGGRSDQIATVMDLLPTLAALSGASLPTDRIIDGRDLSQLISVPQDTRSPHGSFFYFYGNTLWGVRSGRWKLLFEREKRAEDPPEIYGRRTGEILRMALFDLETDIGETTDLSDRHPEIVERLLADAGAFERELWASSRDVGQALITD